MYRRFYLRYNLRYCKVAYEAGPLDQFLTEELSVADRDKPAIHKTTDVAMLLNQARITKEMLPSLNSILENVRSSELSDKFKHLSDEQILACIKPRYVQSPSELIDWSEYIGRELVNLNISEEAKKEIAATPDSSDDTSDKPE